MWLPGRRHLQTFSTVEAPCGLVAWESGEVESVNRPDRVWPQVVAVEPFSMIASPACVLSAHFAALEQAVVISTCYGW